MQKILVIDDSEEILSTVVSALEPIGAVVETAPNMKAALQKILKDRYDFLIVDIGLPDGDGFELLQKVRSIREYSQVPVIFLTSKEDVTSKVSAFSLGVDDYIVKPFNLLELRSRVESRLRKFVLGNTIKDHVEVGPFILEVNSQRLKIRGKEGYISLTPKEFKIFLLLARHPDQIFSREYILDKILGSDIHVTDRTVDAHICYLRKKLENNAKFIESVPGEGYRFNPSYGGVRM